MSVNGGVRTVKLTPPLSDKDVIPLRIGDKVLINGTIYTARDAAHKRIIEQLNRNEKLPFDIKGQIIYYTGPTPPRPGRIIGAAGPTTGYRMDPYTPRLLELGLKGTIGKGYRRQPVIDAMKKYKAVYLMGIGGTGALLSKRIRRVEILAFEDLGPEAIMKMQVEDFPAIVANDTQGNDLFKRGVEKYSIQS